MNILDRASLAAGKAGRSQLSWKVLAGTKEEASVAGLGNLPIVAMQGER